jgi:hypothetical protein
VNSDGDGGILREHVVAFHDLGDREVTPIFASC